MRWFRSSPVHVARGDCEVVRGRVVGQPANTASSLAYSVAGLWLLRRAAAGDVARPDESTATVHSVAEGNVRTVAWAAIAAGLGSVAYHGPGTVVGRALHDGSLGALVGSLAVAEWGLPPTGAAARAAVGAAAVVGAVPAIAPLALGLAGAAVVVAEVVRPAPTTTVAKVERAGSAAVLAMAGPLHLTSRTDRRLCRPQSPWQGHAAWHVLTAGALALRADALLDR